MDFGMDYFFGRANPYFNNLNCWPLTFCPPVSAFGARVLRTPDSVPSEGARGKKTIFQNFVKILPAAFKTLGALFHFCDQLFELRPTFFITFCSRSRRLRAILIFHFQFSSFSYNFFHFITYLENAKKVTRFLISGL